MRLCARAQVHPSNVELLCVEHVCILCCNCIPKTTYRDVICTFFSPAGSPATCLMSRLESDGYSVSAVVTWTTKNATVSKVFYEKGSYIFWKWLMTFQKLAVPTLIITG